MKKAIAQWFRKGNRLDWAKWLAGIAAALVGLCVLWVVGIFVFIKVMLPPPFDFDACMEKVRQVSAYMDGLPARAKPLPPTYGFLMQDEPPPFEADYRETTGHDYPRGVNYAKESEAAYSLYISIGFQRDLIYYSAPLRGQEAGFWIDERDGMPWTRVLPDRQ